MDVSNIPPEVLLQIFLFLSDETTYKKLRRICRVCKSWLPSARAALYQSVTLCDSQIRQFARTIEENAAFVPLIKHLTLCRIFNPSDLIYLYLILKALSHHETLLSLHLNDFPDDDDDFAYLIQCDIAPIEIDFPKITRSLFFLHHLGIDINVFADLHAMKQFVSSFRYLHTLDVSDAFGGDWETAWYRESASDVPPEFPTTIRRLELRLSRPKTLKAFVKWMLRRRSSPSLVHHFSITVFYELDGALIGSLLRAFGAELRSLRLEFRWLESELANIDLSANTNLRTLSHRFVLVQQDPNLMKGYLTRTLKTLSSSSLQTVDVNLRLRNPLPNQKTIDWGFLDEALGNTKTDIALVTKIEEVGR